MSPVQPVILYASRSGRVESLARRLQETARERGVEVECASSGDYDLEQLELAERFAIVLVSTYRAGGPPPAGVPLRDWLAPRQGQAPLDLLEYAVYGLGSSLYVDTFVAFGKLVDTWLDQRGARRVLPMGVGDVRGEHRASFARWQDAVVARLVARYATAIPEPVYPALWANHSGPIQLPAPPVP